MIAVPHARERPPSLATVLEWRWQHYERQLAQLQRGPLAEPDVHRFRVAARRLMTLLRGIRGRPRNADAEALRRAVRRRFKALARLRDVQVERQLAGALARGAPAGAAFLRRLSREEGRLRKELHTGLTQAGLHEERERCDALLHHLRSQAGEAPQRLGLRRWLRRRARAVLRRQADLKRDDPATLHRLRVAIKQFRYALEAAQALGRDGALARPLARAERWQNRLGTLQDLRVLRADCAVFAEQHPQTPSRALLAAIDGALEQQRSAHWRVRGRLVGLVRPFAEDDAPQSLRPGGVRRPARPPTPAARTSARTGWILERHPCA